MQFVTIACEPSQYATILEQIRATGATTPELRRELAGAAFAHTADVRRRDCGLFRELASEDASTGVFATRRSDAVS